MFQNFALKAIAAASPVKIRGVAVAPVSAIAFFEPKAPLKSSKNPSSGEAPAARINNAANINVTKPDERIAHQGSQAGVCSRPQRSLATCDARSTVGLKANFGWCAECN